MGNYKSLAPTNDSGFNLSSLIATVSGHDTCLKAKQDGFGFAASCWKNKDTTQWLETIQDAMDQVFLTV